MFYEMQSYNFCIYLIGPFTLQFHFFHLLNLHFWLCCYATFTLDYLHWWLIRMHFCCLAKKLIWNLRNVGQFDIWVAITSLRKTLCLIWRISWPRGIQLLDLLQMWNMNFVEQVHCHLVMHLLLELRHRLRWTYHV